jgi:tellurite resistance protein TerC
MPSKPGHSDVIRGGTKMANDLPLWLGFNVLVAVMLALDLGVFHRHAHQVSLKEAAIWSAVWISLSLAFCAIVNTLRGSESGLQFLSGYLIEKALSVDNIFVFVLIFSYFKVPQQYQHRVLFWGILGALAMRAAMIFAGAALIARFDWIMYIFGGFLVITGWRLATRQEESPDPSNNPVVRLARRLMPFTDQYQGQSFFVRRAGRSLATPLFLVLLVVETTDLVFATDSIPAVFAVSQDPFIVYTSNVFAILGLRALYFLVGGMLQRLRHLQYGLAIILAFVGAKMLLRDIYHIPTLASLVFIAAVLAMVVVTSLFSERRAKSSPVAESVERQDV